MISGRLGDRGRVFFIDESRDAWCKEEFLQENLVLRRLRDGSTHRAIKFFWEPSELEERLRALGWDVRVESTGDFLWVSARCRRDERGAGRSGPATQERAH